jgi:hypothetical protein
MAKLSSLKADDRVSFLDDQEKQLCTGLMKVADYCMNAVAAGRFMAGQLARAGRLPLTPPQRAPMAGQCRRRR